MSEKPFEQFMIEYQDMVFATAIRLLGNPTEAQDIAQEVFMKAYQRYAELQHSPTKGGWLKTVATNLCLNHLSRYRGRWRFFSEFAASDEENEPQWDIAVEEQTTTALEEADQKQLLETALQQLPPAQRIPLVLYHFEDYSYDQIASAMKISLAKVKTDIFRAREALRVKLRLQVEEETRAAAHPVPPRRTERTLVRNPFEELRAIFAHTPA